MREYTFCHSKRKYRGIPIMASNMDTVGTLPVSKEMSRNSLFTTIAKQVTVQEWIDFAKENPDSLEVKKIKNKKERKFFFKIFIKNKNSMLQFLLE